MARSRLLAALLLVGSLLAAAAIGGPAARAGTRDAEPSTLRIAIDDINPLAPVETSMLVVRGTVTNPGSTPVSSLSLAIGDAGPAESRADLDALGMNVGDFRRDFGDGVSLNTVPLLSGKSFTRKL